MTTLQELESFDLDSLPTPVLVAVLSQLSYADAQRLCATRKNIRRKCLQLNLLDIKAREELQREAPLAQQFITREEHVKLIHRGFVTTYRFNLNEDRSGAGRVEFGNFEADNDDGQRTFMMVGLPPPKGTTVFVVTRMWRQDDTTGVYLSLAEIRASIDQYLEMKPEQLLILRLERSDYLLEYTIEVMGTYPDEEKEAVDAFMKNRDDGDFIILELTLP